MIIANRPQYLEIQAVPKFWVKFHIIPEMTSQTISNNFNIKISRKS